MNKISIEFSDQQQPPQARKPTTPEILLIILYNSNYAPLLNIRVNDKQQAAKRVEIQISINVNILY